MGPEQFPRRTGGGECRLRRHYMTANPVSKMVLRSGPTRGSLGRFFKATGCSPIVYAPAAAATGRPP